MDHNKPEPTRNPIEKSLLIAISSYKNLCFDETELIIVLLCVCGDDLCPYKGFEPGFFPLKFNPLTFEYKIHSVEVDLYYFKYL